MGITKELRERIIRMIKSGHSVVEIAKMYNIPEVVIRTISSRS